MVVREDHCRRVVLQCLLDHLARMNLGAVDRSTEHLDVLNQPMARIEEQNREDLVLEARELGAQILLDHCR